MTRSEDFLCATIRGDSPSYIVGDEEHLEQLVEAAFHHGLHLIFFEIVKASSTWTLWPFRLREKLKDEARIASCSDMLNEHELRRILSRLNKFGVQSILLKGAALSYTLYKSPALRPRSDTDLLIQEGDLDQVAELLRECGYEAPRVPANDTNYECLYRRKSSLGICHKLDLHWKISNVPLFARTFTFDELHSEAIQIASLGAHALGLGHAHALFLACMHRFAHAHAPFYVGKTKVCAADHLRWVYDIHLLCSGVESEQWSKLTAMASAKNIAGFCADGLNAAREAFNTKVPTEAMEALQTAADNETANVERLRASEAAWLLANLRALPNLWHRLAFIKGACFPPAAHMLDKYQTDNRLVLPFLYGYRSVMGVLRATNALKIQK